MSIVGVLFNIAVYTYSLINSKIPGIIKIKHTELPIKPPPKPNMGIQMFFASHGHLLFIDQILLILPDFPLLTK